MGGELVSRVRNRPNRSRVHNVTNKANHRRPNNPLKPPQRVRVRNATSARVAAEEAAIEVSVRNAKRNPRAKHNLH